MPLTRQHIDTIIALLLTQFLQSAQFLQSFRYGHVDLSKDINMIK